VRHKGCVVAHFGWTAHKTLRDVAEMKAWLDAKSLFRHQRLADRRMTFWRTVFQSAVVSTEHKPHAENAFNTAVFVKKTNTKRRSIRRRRRRKKEKEEEEEQQQQQEEEQEQNNNNNNNNKG